MTKRTKDLVTRLSYAAAAAIAATEKKYLEIPLNQNNHSLKHPKNNLHIEQHATEKKFPKSSPLNPRIDQPEEFENTTARHTSTNTDQKPRAVTKRPANGNHSARPSGRKTGVLKHGLFAQHVPETTVAQDVRKAQADELISAILHEEMKRTLPAFTK